jgi:hypothetical protein
MLSFFLPLARTVLINGFVRYANNLAIPDEVMEHPLIASLGEAANDLVTWSNVCPSSPLGACVTPRANLSCGAGHLLVQRRAVQGICTFRPPLYRVYSHSTQGDTHNMIPVVMNEQGLDLQSAVDFVGEMCKQSINRFIDDRAALPSWGVKIDRDVSVYVDGLANWIVGSLHWSFMTERYFGTNGAKIKAGRVVNLLPQRI